MARPVLFTPFLLFACLAVLPAKAQEATPDEFRLGMSTEGYTYFNRPGAEISQHDEELKVCLKESAKVRSADEELNGGGGGIVGFLVVAALSDGVRPSAVENCMVVRGWRVVVLPEPEGKALDKLPPEEISRTLALWVGAETPEGRIARSFHNDAITAKTKRFELRPPGENRYRLSAKSLGDLDDGTKDREEPPKPTKVHYGKAIKKSQDVFAPPGMALVILSLQNQSLRNGAFIEFQRMDEAANKMTPGSKAEPNAIQAGAGGWGTKKEVTWRAFAVPPGRWRLARIISGLQILNMCLGAPSIEIREGEVIFLGAFDMGGEALGPDLSLEQVKQWLNSQAGTENVQPATYTNGWTGECGSTSIYALEFSGVPFRDGYQWGSAYVAAAALAAAPTEEPAAPELQPADTPLAVGPVTEGPAPEPSTAPAAEPPDSAPESTLVP